MIDSKGLVVGHLVGHTWDTSGTCLVTTSHTEKTGAMRWNMPPPARAVSPTDNSPLADCYPVNACRLTTR